MSYIVIVDYVPGTVQNTLQSFSYLPILQPVVDACKSVTMETTTQENIPPNLSPLPHPLTSKFLNLQNQNTKN